MAADPLKSVDALTDPGAAVFVAEQLNTNRPQGAPRVLDLSGAIKDIILQSAVQGASILEVHVEDPNWGLLTSGFIQVDAAGLILPIDVNFPQGTDCWWRIAAMDVSTDLTDANLILTFEDRIVEQLRNLGHQRTAGLGQTRAEFIQSIVRDVPGIDFIAPTLQHPEPGTANPVVAPVTPPSSAPSGSSSARHNPGKTAGVGKALVQGALGAHWDGHEWVYSKPINGLSPKELRILNPPTTTPDAGPPGTGRGFTG